MKKYLLLLALSINTSILFAAEPTAEDMALYLNFISDGEGYRDVPYLDAFSGDNVVGIGHNLTVHHDKLKSRYSVVEIHRFFVQDLTWALRAARSYIVNFDAQPNEVKQVVVGVIWTVGPEGFARFVKFRLAVIQAKYILAGEELRKSKWKDQVGESRYKTYRNILLSVKSK